MTLTDMVRLIGSRLGKRTGLVQDIAAEIAMTQVKLESSELLPWFRIWARKDATALTWVSTTNVYTNPPAFIRGVEDISVFWRPEPAPDLPYRIKPLITRPFQELASDESIDHPAGPPRFYAIQGSIHTIWPMPDKDYIPTVIAYFRDSPLVLGTTETNSWTENAADLIVSETGFRMATTLRDTAAAQIFAEERREANDRFRKAEAAARAHGIEPVMVD